MDLHKSYIAHQTEDCTFELDEYRNEAGEQMLLAHLAVHKWTPEALKRIRHDWRVFRSVVTAPLFAVPLEEDRKWIKFVTLMGWRPCSRVICHDGNERPLFIHTVGT